MKMGSALGLAAHAASIHGNKPLVIEQAFV
jgi:hypothetical protein